MTESSTGQARILAGRYELGKFIGQGGMATVYRGTDTKLGRQVAIKIMKAELADDDNFRERFRNEAHAASRMAHPTIVRVLDAGDDLIQTAAGPKKLPFIVMEYVDGKNLRQHLNEGRFSIEEASRVITAVLTALEYSHKAGIVHRDIKPANIMITNNGKVKVMDFGIARAVSETSSSLQQTTQILGTAAYFSPEQAKGETVDHRSDLYSIGVMLYEMLTGFVPFRGDNAISVAYQHVTERPVPPSDHDLSITPAFDRLVLHSLVKDKSKRFQSAAEFNEALTVALSGKVPDLTIDEENNNLLFGDLQNQSPDYAMQQLYETNYKRSQPRPPIMWIWAFIVTLIVVIAAMLVWLIQLEPQRFSASSEVPTLTYIEKSQAINKLKNVHLNANVVEKSDPNIAEGLVIGTDPEPGSRLKPEETITLFVSSGPEKPKLPNLVGESKESAQKQLEALGLKLGEISTKDDGKLQKDTVMEMSPDAGTQVKVGSKINITVASGKVNVPDVKGQSLQAAQAILKDKNINTNIVPKSCAITASGLPIIEQSVVGTQEMGVTVTVSYCVGLPQPQPPAQPTPNQQPSTQQPSTQQPAPGH